MRLAWATLISILLASSSSARADEHVQKRFWLTWHESAERRPQYDITVMINGARAATIAAGESPRLLDVTSWMRPGANVVLFVANKNRSGARLSDSEADTMTVRLGQDFLVGNATVDHDLLVEVGRSAAETDAYLTEARFVNE